MFSVLLLFLIVNNFNAMKKGIGYSVKYLFGALYRNKLGLTDIFFYLNIRANN